MSLPAGKTTAVVATLMVPLLLLVACSHAPKPQPAPPRVTLGYCGSNPQVRPDVVLVVCNTNDITAENLTWSDWGMPAAVNSMGDLGQDLPVPPRNQTVSLTC